MTELLPRALEGVFWLGAALVVYVYAAYPLLLVAAGALRRRTTAADDGYLPAVTVIIAAHNEAAGLAARLDNLLALDYPRGLCEIIVVDDGSTDATAEIARGYAARGVVLLTRVAQQGKTAAQNRAVLLARGEVLVFADANGSYAPAAVRKMVRHFADAGVGCVCGALYYTRGERPAGFAEKIYWRYENLLKRQESRSGSLIGVNGAIYALPRRLFRVLPDGVMSDLTLPLHIRAQGFRVIYEPEAVCEEPVHERARAGFMVKRRIVLRALTSVAAEWRTLRLIRHPWFAVKLVSHKLLRWLLPLLFLVLLLVCGLLGCSDAGLAVWYRMLFELQLLFLLLALTGALADRFGINLRLLALPYYFCLVNFAALAATLDFLRGRRIIAWPPQR